MELRDYLHFKRISVKDFASIIGYARPVISAVKNNARIPSVRMVRAIEQATNGKVTRYELLKDCKEKIDKV